MAEYAAGSVADTHTYPPYGSLTASTGTDPNPFRYGGQVGYYTDPYADGLVLCGQRWYAPGYARWLSRDPAGYAGGANLYAYCGGDPVNGLDPDGCDAISEVHHIVARFLAGTNDAWNLIRMPTQLHRELTEDMRVFMRTMKNSCGQDMQPRVGNTGAMIRANFSKDEILDALRQFYTLNQAKYPEVARQFFAKWGPPIAQGARTGAGNVSYYLGQFANASKPLAEAVLFRKLP